MSAFLRFLGLGGRDNGRIIDAVYATIVAAARQPALYRDYGVPDTPLGRFEMLSLHMGLLLRAARGADPRVMELVQAVTEEFFKDVDHSLRELGIGDTGVPKRMKKLASMFYGRVDAYASALDAGDMPALAAALSRNVAPESTLADAAGLADYARAAAAAIAPGFADALLAGKLDFSPTAGEVA
ncbi:MAG: ubiquinol-cytochrome C chaperone [Phyllobacteriaceae bacterium]|nr:ubiquinol-cytochrome C chaperone [Phyllobacteriaceae bacterium]